MVSLCYQSSHLYSIFVQLSYNIIIIKLVLFYVIKSDKRDNETADGEQLAPVKDTRNTREVTSAYLSFRGYKFKDCERLKDCRMHEVRGDNKIRLPHSHLIIYVCFYLRLQRPLNVSRTCINIY